MKEANKTQQQTTTETGAEVEADDVKNTPKEEMKEEEEKNVPTAITTSDNIKKENNNEVGGGAAAGNDNEDGDKIDNKKSYPYYHTERQLTHRPSLHHYTATTGSGKSGIKKLLKLKNELNFIIPTIQIEKQHVEEKHGKNSWQNSVQEFLHQHWFQRFLMLLLFVDVVILFIEIFLSASYPTCNLIIRDCINCCPTITTILDTVAQAAATTVAATTTTANDEGGAQEEDDPTRLLLVQRYLEVDDEQQHGSFCDIDGTGSYEENLDISSSCDPYKYENIHEIEGILFYMTITILSIFLIELNIQMIVIGPIIFLKQGFFTLDYIIVVISFILEMSKKFLWEKEASEEVDGDMGGDDGHDETIMVASMIEIIIFTRIWRFVRIGHGIAEITVELEHETHSHHTSHNEHSSSNNNTTTMEQLQDYVGKLESIIKDNGLELPTKEKEEENADSESVEIIRKKHYNSGHGSDGHYHDNNGNNNDD